MKKKHLKFFKLAKEIAKTSNYGKIKIGAVIVRKNMIVSVGVNIRKSHPLQKKYNHLRFDLTAADNCHHYIHAETAAIIHAGSTDLSDCVIYVYREDLNGALACSRPCPACLSLIGLVGIKKIFYTTREGLTEESLL